LNSAVSHPNDPLREALQTDVMSDHHHCNVLMRLSKIIILALTLLLIEFHK
jgi:hypothetical protein